MTNNAQIRANQQNALKSTGPNSARGKSIASQNSIKHGLLSKDLVIRDEKQNDLDAFKQRIYFALSPQGAMEELLTDKLINAAWRLHRLTKIESAILNGRDWIGDGEGLNESFNGDKGESLQTLSRYESSLERNFYKALHELQRLQAMRLGHAVLAPIAIEISGNLESEIGFVS